MSRRALAVSEGQRTCPFDPRNNLQDAVCDAQVRDKQLSSLRRRSRDECQHRPQNRKGDFASMFSLIHYIFTLRELLSEEAYKKMIHQIFRIDDE